LRRSLVLLLAGVTLSVFLRLLPTVVTGYPVSVDAWPLVESADVLCRHSDVRIWDDQRLDSYNNKWPFTILLGALTSKVLGTHPLHTLRILVPAINGLAAVVVVLLVSLYCPSRVSGYISALVYGCAASIVVFTSGVAKEVLAHYFFFLLLWLVSSEVRGVKSLFLLALLSVSLVLTHHMTSFMFFGVSLAILLMKALCWVLGRSDPPPPAMTLAPFAAFTLASVHYVFWGRYGFKLSLTYSEAFTLAMYSLAFFSVPVIFEFRGQPRVLRGLSTSVRVAVEFLLLVVAAVLTLSSTRLYLVAGRQTVTAVDAIIYGFSFMAPLLLIGAYEGPKDLSVWRFLLGPWLAFVLSVIAFPVFTGNPFFTSVLHRLFNFLMMALALFFGVVVYELGRGLTSKLLVSISLILIVLTGVAAQVRALSPLNESSFYRVHHGYEVEGFKVIAGFCERGASIVGGAKVSYFYTLYPLSVNTGRAVILALRGKAPPRGSLVVLSRDNLEKGVVVSLDVNRFTREGLNRLGDMDKVFGNGYVYAYRV